MAQRNTDRLQHETSHVYQEMTAQTRSTRLYRQSLLKCKLSCVLLFFLRYKTLHNNRLPEVNVILFCSTQVETKQVTDERRNSATRDTSVVRKTPHIII